jgi:hypothetical protein
MADRRKKLVFAGVLLVTGVGGAMLFRRPPTAREFPEHELTGLVLQALDPSVSLPIPPLPPDSLPALPESVPTVVKDALLPDRVVQDPAVQDSAPSPTPHLLGSIELTESTPKPNSIAPAAARTERPVFELPEPSSARAVASAPSSASPSVQSTPPAKVVPAKVAPAKVMPVSSMPSINSAAQIPDGHWRLHQVQEGETLSSLSRRYLGAADRYPELFAANRDVLQSPDRLPRGVTLRVPTANCDVEAESSTLPAAPIVPIPPGAWRRGDH